MSHAITHWDGKSWRFSEFHNTNKLKKVAILVCGGPSLKKIDVSKLKGPGKVVLGLNTTYPYIVPDMWMGMDDPRCYDRNILLEAFPKFLRGPLHKRVVQGIQPKDLHNVHYINVRKCKWIEMWKSYHRDSASFVWHNHVMAVAMNLLLSMGFKEIYIAGCDLTMADKHYFDDRQLIGKEHDRNVALYREMIPWIKYISENITKETGCKLFSLSPDSTINDMMPFMTVEQLNKRVDKYLFEPGPYYNAHTLGLMRRQLKDDSVIK
jgi:hypothetical protein